MESNPHLEIEEDEIEVLEVKRGEGFETANSCSNKDSEEPNIEIRSSVSSLIQRDEEEEEMIHLLMGILSFKMQHKRMDTKALHCTRMLEMLKSAPLLIWSGTKP